MAQAVLKKLNEGATRKAVVAKCMQELGKLVDPPLVLPDFLKDRRPCPPLIGLQPAILIIRH